MTTTTEHIRNNLAGTARRVADHLDAALDARSDLPRPVSLHVGLYCARAQLGGYGLTLMRDLAAWARFAGSDVTVRLEGGPGLSITLVTDEHDFPLIIEAIVGTADVIELGRRLRWPLGEGMAVVTVDAAQFAAAVFEDGESVS